MITPRIAEANVDDGKALKDVLVRGNTGARVLSDRSHDAPNQGKSGVSAWTRVTPRSTASEREQSMCLPGCSNSAASACGR